jgi:hypothetical protein
MLTGPQFEESICDGRQLLIRSRRGDVDIAAIQ